MQHPPTPAGVLFCPLSVNLLLCLLLSLWLHLAFLLGVPLIEQVMRRQLGGAIMQPASP
ncbi:MAG: hypothetical protein U0350_42100 [Caldilineaceae bacterium]